jgi:hypothetical protein
MEVVELLFPHDNLYVGHHFLFMLFLIQTKVSPLK